MPDPIDTDFSVDAKTAERDFLKRVYDLGRAQEFADVAKNFRAGVDARMDVAMLQMLEMKKLSFGMAQLHVQNEDNKQRVAQAYTQLAVDSKFRFVEMDAANKRAAMDAGVRLSTTRDTIAAQDRALAQELIIHQESTASQERQTAQRVAADRYGSWVQRQNRVDELDFNKTQEARKNVISFIETGMIDVFAGDNGEVTYEALSKRMLETMRANNVGEAEAMRILSSEAAAYANSLRARDPDAAKYALEVTPEQVQLSLKARLSNDAEAVRAQRVAIATQLQGEEQAKRELARQDLAERLEASSVIGFSVIDGEMHNPPVQLQILKDRIQSIESATGRPLQPAELFGHALAAVGNSFGPNDERAAEELLIALSLDDDRYDPATRAGRDFVTQIRIDRTASAVAGDAPKQQRQLSPEAQKAAESTAWAREQVSIIDRAAAELRRPGNNVPGLQTSRAQIIGLLARQPDESSASGLRSMLADVEKAIVDDLAGVEQPVVKDVEKPKPKPTEPESSIRNRAREAAIEAGNAADAAGKSRKEALEAAIRAYKAVNDRTEPGMDWPLIESSIRVTTAADASPPDVTDLATPDTATNERVKS